MLVVERGLRHGAVCGGPPGQSIWTTSRGKVTLISTTDPTFGSCPLPASTLDFVGYGTADCSEGSPAPSLISTTSAIRQSQGCEDTNNNAFDVAGSLHHGTAHRRLRAVRKASTIFSDRAFSTLDEGADIRVLEVARYIRTRAGTRRALASVESYRDRTKRSTCCPPGKR